MNDKYYSGRQREIGNNPKKQNMIKLTFQSIDFEKQWCKTSISRVANTRTTEYYTNSNSPNWRTHIQSKWSTSTNQPSSTFDISSSFYFDTTKSSFYSKLDNPFGRDLSEDEFELEIKKEDWTLKQMISSYLLMYRSTCTFPHAIKTFDEHKIVWQCHLKHNETGRFFGFSEWKGCASVRGTDDCRVLPILDKLVDRSVIKSLLGDKNISGSLILSYATDLPDNVFESLPTNEARVMLREYLDANKVFLADACELQNYIVSDQCEHPYDNLVAGCIA